MCERRSQSQTARGEDKKNKRIEKRSANTSLNHKPFKKARKELKDSYSAPSEMPASFLVEADDSDFPRGGGSILSRQEEARAEAEVEFEMAEGNSWKDMGKASKKKKKRGLNGLSADVDELGSLFGDGLTGQEGFVRGGSEILVQPGRTTCVLPLQVSLEDSEDSDVDNLVSAEQDDTKVSEQAAKKDRRLKRKAKEEKELEICASEERRLQNGTPRTEDEFEKLVRSSPNSSFVWIKYMAHMLSLADVEKARSVAERALKTINSREESEKSNIWVAYFNLENEYGNPPEEAVKKLFQRALQYCDPKKLHLALLGVYERTEQYNLVDQLSERMTKKFRHSCKVWLRCIQNFLKKNKDGIQFIINRALLSVLQKKHLKFMSRTALLEFKIGSADRGRSMFETMLREYPKRTDLWSIYLDQEIRLGDAQVIRALFERATCLGLPLKKIKFLIKKYLDYEKARGDEGTIEHVKRRAMAYVESNL